MKIVIIQGAFFPIPPIIGGAVEKRWYKMGHEFAKNGHEVIHISRKYNSLRESEQVNGVNYIRIKGYENTSNMLKLKLMDLMYSMRVLKHIPKNADVIVTNTFWSPILLRGRIGKRVFVDVARIPKGQMNFYKHVGILRANSTAVINAIKKELTENVNCSVEMIPNFLPFEMQQSINFDQKEKVILYVGRIHPEKGLLLLIKAFNELNTDWSLRIIGPWEVEQGGGGNSFYQTLTEISNPSKVSIVGPIYDIEKLNDEYKRASIFVYPSLAEKGETFGLAPLEAMAWGCVPIVSNLLCFKDFIIESVNGLIFNHRSQDAVNLLRENILKLIINQDKRRVLAKKALGVNKTHSVKQIAFQFLDSFDQLTVKNSVNENS